MVWYGKYGEIGFLDLFVIFLIFALYGRWEAGNSLKMLSQDVGTFSTIASVILGTFIFRHFLDPQSPMAKVRPALRKAGRTLPK